MPLLRDQLRVTKARRAGAITAALFGVGAIAGAIALGTSGEEDEPMLEMAELDAGVPLPVDSEAELDGVAADDDLLGEGSAHAEGEAPTEAARTVADVAPSAPSAVERKTALFGQARSFRHALVAAGVSRDECTELEASLTSVLDFRRCQPDDRMFIERDATGKLVRFEYHPDNVEYVVSQRAADGQLVSEHRERPIDRIRIVRAGRVQTSIGEALEQAGLGRSLVGVFIDVFGGRANFNTDTRTGDSFRIAVDEERLDGKLLRYGTVHAIEYQGSRTGTIQAFYYETSSGEGDYYDATGRSLHGSWLRVPVRYDHISSPYDPNRMHPILRRVRPHNGVDLAAGTGTPVVAAAAGVVTWAGPKGANGNLIGIRHDGGYQTYYAHLYRIESGIRRGVRVSQRQLIGQVGSTGRSTGPHLHFGLKRGSAFLDPMAVINGPGRMLPSGHLAAFRRRARALTRELETAGRQSSRITADEGEHEAM